MAPPPARRSTRCGGHVQRLHAGSSACAEIDPVRNKRHCLIKWLLRLRGDRPLHSGHDRDKHLAPPPARRSTRIWRHQARFASGSSACAEIDPSLLRARSITPGLLRLRGDRPYKRYATQEEALAPPPARRSTPSTSPVISTSVGSSACAEIDPNSSAPTAAPVRLLRLRGDRPELRSRPLARTAAPPPARRSTPLARRVRRHAMGSSACAEIDPRGEFDSQETAWLLRLRGDRPVAEGEWAALADAPPPARRSTHYRPQHGDLGRGSSACAERRHPFR